MRRILPYLVAENITGSNLSAKDVIFSIHAPGAVPQIDGPSAGALMTAVVTAAIENRTLNQSVTLTGTINPDGTIGAIGGVTDKAQAAKDSGKLLFLLPEANRVLSFTTPAGSNFFGMALNRQVTQTADAKEYIENRTGIRVMYVSNISEVAGCPGEMTTRVIYRLCFTGQNLPESGQEEITSTLHRKPLKSQLEPRH